MAELTGLILQKPRILYCSTVVWCASGSTGKSLHSGMLVAQREDIQRSACDITAVREENQEPGINAVSLRV